MWSPRQGKFFAKTLKQGPSGQLMPVRASLQQLAAGFAHPMRGAFDWIVDGLNCLPHHVLASGTIWLFVSATRTPAEFVRGMQGLALVPEPLWWLMGTTVSFYFGMRHQVKALEFQTSVAQALTTQRQGPDEAYQTPAPRMAGT
ncbi:MAG: hypothetical protein ACJAVT_001870 [Yoonia sp.]|jgi:hypothetical protein